jgi:transposase
MPCRRSRAGGGAPGAVPASCTPTRLTTTAVAAARRGIDRSQRLGRHRWVIERTFAWINRFRRLAVRYERRLDIHYAFTALACSLIRLNAHQGRF